MILITPGHALKCLRRLTPKGQKFPAGCRVRIADDLGPTMSHFTNSADATVLYSYRQRFGGSANLAKQYALDIDGRGFSAWYLEHQLTIIPE